ncbi:Coenzyme F420 hydrogenase/dehydrogenase, beta subunit C-terminal domain [Agromyces sp. GXQ0307]|uniref:Coenzyme F420 hydrogenase/dehydrogenase, beta subunit C-terminal domain n=1 Tax=Agromyces sp. GXQ0307 TaxID=3377835 RepID=UPI003839F233
MTHGIEQVVERGMCIGCGACSVRTSGAIPVTIGRHGVYEARLGDAIAPDALRAASRVCPFSDEARNEDALTRERFPDLPKDDRIGAHLEVLAGRRTSEQEIIGSSSGGLTSLLLEELLRAGLVDGVLHVGRSAGDPRFSYTVSTSPEEIEQNRKSMYSATTLADVVADIRGDGRTYAVVGVPCFIKALRLLASELPDLDAQFGVYVGLVCGHLKSTFFAESLAWQAGVPPTELEGIDFRVKNPGRYAWDYDYDAVDADGVHHVRRSADTIDGGWGFGAFQPEACNFCDDVVAEGADVAFADAWLHKYAADWHGTNAVILRDERVRALLRAAAERGDVELEPLSVGDAARSQAGGFRHRRDGLALRLADDLAAGLSVPAKRVAPDRNAVSRRRAAVLRQRRRISRLSLTAFAEARADGDFDRYARPMRRAIRRYRLLDAWSQGTKALARHVARPVVHRARRMLRR